LASLSCQLNGVEPKVHVANVIARIALGHIQIEIDQLLPRSCRCEPSAAA
jgi:hypothetical protein